MSFSLLIIAGLLLTPTRQPEAYAAGPLTFAAKEDYGAGDQPFSVAVGDFNSDGQPDLAVANYGTHNVSVLLNNGDGTFTPKEDYDTGLRPFSVAVGDFNTDGKPDLAVANASSNNVSVLLNNGDGTFAPKEDYPVGNTPRAVAVGDFNVDGKPDLAVANAGSADVSVLLNDGDGTFDDTTGDGNYGAGNGPRAVAVGDFNSDGQPDLAVANERSANVSVLLNNGDGTFAPKEDYDTSKWPFSVAVGDFNSDGKPDLAVANSGAHKVSVLLNNGDGTFAPKVDYPVGLYPWSVAVGDFNGDGKPDLAVTDGGGANVSVLLNNGDGTFAPKEDYPAGLMPSSVAVGDFNGDGKPDLAVANCSDDDVSVLLNTTVFDPYGAFAPKVDYDTGTWPYSVAVGDFNGDGQLDLAVANNGTHNVSVLLNNGDGTFADKVDYGAGWWPSSVAVGDFNTDGKPDLAVSNELGDDVSVLLNDGDGTFDDTTGDGSYPVGDMPMSVAVGDFNVDGQPDLAAGHWGSNYVSVLLNNGDGTFAPKEDYPAGERPVSVAVGDFNTDGQPDLVAANTGSDNVSVLLNNGDGTFAPPEDYPVGDEPRSVAVGDFNSDGQPDLAVVSGDNVSVLLNNGDGTFIPPVDYPVGTYPTAVAVGDFNSDGQPDLAVANEGSDNVSVLLNNGDGTFAPKEDYPVGTGPYSVAVGDFNVDGQPDLAVANYWSDNVSVLLNTMQFTLIVNKAGTGTGTVTSDPAGINCGVDCTEDYDRDTVVTLTAMPDANSVFAGWSGDCDANGQVTMDTNKTCTATFNLKQFTLTVNKVGTGTGTVISGPSGIDCGTDCTEDYDVDTVVTLAATPDANSVFAGWSGDSDCSDGQVTMDAGKACTATFNLKQFTLTVNKAGTGTGTVTSSPTGIDCGGDCTEDYDVDTVVTLAATPDANSVFAGWSGDCDANGQVTMDTNRTCTATFNLKQFTLIVDKVGIGTGTVISDPAGINCGVDCTEDYVWNTVVTLTVMLGPDSFFIGWSGDCDANGQVTMNTNKTCTATFGYTWKVFLPLMTKDVS